VQFDSPRFLGCLRIFIATATTAFEPLRRFCPSFTCLMWSYSAGAVVRDRIEQHAQGWANPDGNVVSACNVAIVQRNQVNFYSIHVERAPESGIRTYTKCVATFLSCRRRKDDAAERPVAFAAAHRSSIMFSGRRGFGTCTTCCTPSSLRIVTGINTRSQGPGVRVAASSFACAWHDPIDGRLKE
jgi:hypothetical protein